MNIDLRNPKLWGIASAFSVGLLGVSLYGTSPAKAAEPADWCKAISGGVFCAEPAPTPPEWCGTKEISIALADGTVNPWRQLTAANAFNEASKCPNVTGFEHTDGQNNTQKSISDINSLVARGVNAIILFPDAGPALLPAMRDGFKQGVTMVPYRISPGGVEGKDYSFFVPADVVQDGVIWANWMVKALNGKGNVAYLGGPAGNTQSTGRAKGIKQVLEKYPDIKLIGDQPFEVTNFDSSMMAKALTALISKYPSIDGLFVDSSYAVLTSGAFQRANKPLPKIAGEDVNAYGCTWKQLHAKDANDNFQYSSISAGTWNVRLAVRWAIATAAGGKMDQPLTLKMADGSEIIGADAGSKDIKNFQLEDSTASKTFCIPGIPDTASVSTSLSDQQVQAALKGGF